MLDHANVFLLSYSSESCRRLVQIPQSHTTDALRPMWGTVWLQYYNHWLEGIFSVRESPSWMSQNIYMVIVISFKKVDSFWQTWSVVFSTARKAPYDNGASVVKAPLLLFSRMILISTLTLTGLLRYFQVQRNSRNQSLVPVSPNLSILGFV